MFGFLKNKKYPYVGGGDPARVPVKKQSLSAGIANAKSELGKAFDYIMGRKKKKKEGEA